MNKKRKCLVGHDDDSSADPLPQIDQTIERRF